MLYAELQKGADFAKLAESYSEDPRTAPGGGDMGFIPASSVASDPALRQALGSLGVGKFTPILRDGNGTYRIFKLLGKEASGQRDLSNPQVQTAIRQTLASEKEQLLKAAYLEQLRDQAKVVNHLADRIVKAGGVPAGLN